MTVLESLKENNVVEIKCLFINELDKGPYISISKMMAEMPERTFDVGIAEQHAVTFSAGMATQGKVPFCAITVVVCS